MRRQFLLVVGFLAICSSCSYLALAQQNAAPAASNQQMEAPPASGQQAEAPAASGQQTEAPAASNAQCIDCHSKSKPQIVSEWKQSKHSQVNVGCIDCHGAGHASASDVAKVKIARPEICARCHQTQVDQDRRGKHALALAAMRTMPNAHWRPARSLQPEPVGSGQAVCADCHRIGSSGAKEEVTFERFGGIEGGALGRGAGACGSCHSRHTFSVEEARQPQACQYCHSGPDHDQWGMYASSRHGIQFDLKQRRLLPADAAVPTCQTCHMPNGDHEVRTSWGYRGIIRPLPSDKEWAADRTEIMKAMNILGSNGEENPLAVTMKAAEVMRFTQEDWQRDRDKMVKVCVQCHSENYVKQQLQAGDDMVRLADHFLAEAIRVVSGLYKDGLLPPPQPERNYPWLTRFDPPPTLIEQMLETMYLEHRTSAFQGKFHGSLNYALADGRGKLRQDLDAITDLAKELRRSHAATGTHHPVKTASPAKPKAK